MEAPSPNSDFFSRNSNFFLPIRTLLIYLFRAIVLLFLVIQILFFGILLLFVGTLAICLAIPTFGLLLQILFIDILTSVLEKLTENLHSQLFSDTPEVDQAPTEKRMHDLIGLLRKRNVSESTIDKMKEDKIDPSVLLLMTDEELKNYLPSYGDRLAVMGFCKKQEDTLYSCKSKLFQKLKENLSEEEKSSNDTNDESDKQI